MSGSYHPITIHPITIQQSLARCAGHNGFFAISDGMVPSVTLRRCHGQTCLRKPTSHGSTEAMTWVCPESVGGIIS
jgi:hypothetical protein